MNTVVFKNQQPSDQALRPMEPGLIAKTRSLWPRTQED